MVPSLRIATALTALIALAACSGPSSPPPASFADRPRLPACGVIDRASLPNPLTRADHAALRCFRNAVADKRPAELTVLHMPQADGTADVYVRVLGPGHVEEFWHLYAFRHGGNGWSSRECTSFTSMFSPTGLLFPRPGPQCRESQL